MGPHKHNKARLRQRIAAISILVFVVTVLYLFQGKQGCTFRHGVEMKDGVSFQNLNMNPTEGVLLLSIIEPSTMPHLDTFLNLVGSLRYPHLSAGFLITDPSPANILAFWNGIERAKLTLDSVHIYTKPFDLGTIERAQQPLRRMILAKARNFLLQALKPGYGYVLWLDSLIVEVPPTLVDDLIAVGTDVVVPNTMTRKGNSVGGYDKSNWRETDKSIALQRGLPEESLFVEGWEPLTHRSLLVDITAEGRPAGKVPLDGIGPSCILVKADIHRSGINFPAYPYRHQIDTEAFAKVAQDEGYDVFGLPDYKIYHFGQSDEATEGAAFN